MKRFIHADSIVIAPNRQRRDHDIAAHQDLVESIRARGLFHPPVLRIEGDSHVLVAGERRLRAIADLTALGEEIRHDAEPVISGMVPYVLLGELTPLEAEEAELDENIRRLDLSWQERATATARLADLRRRQAEAVGGIPPTVADIAVEIKGRGDGAYHEEVRQEILLSRHLDNPLIAKAGTAKEAFKILKKAETSERNHELARNVGKSFTGSSHTILNTDSLGWMEASAGGAFDVILTDPPYGMGADTFGDSGGLAPGGGAHFYKDDYDTWNLLISRFAALSARVAKDSAHLYCFCDFGRFAELASCLGAAGWKVFRTPLIWYKPNGNRAPWPDAGPQRKYELILFATRGGRKVNSLRGDVLEYRADENLGHPAQKPVGLFEDLLRRSCLPGDKVLDPFAGSGPIVAAAHNCKIYATAIEQDPASYGVIVQRVKELV